MRVLIVSTSMGMGGADQQVLTLAHTMRARGHEVRIVALAPLGPMGVEAQQAGIQTESLDVLRNVAALPRMLRLIRIIREWRPDIVHSHMVHANLLTRALRPFAPVPALISTIHNIYDGGRLRMLAYRLTSGLVDQVTIISQLAAKRYIAIKAVPPALLRVIPNAVDTARFRKVPEARAAIRQELGLGEEFVWVAVGRFEKAKDYPNMIDAFARVLAKRPTSKLLLVGKGSLQAEVEQHVKAKRVESQVRFLGVRRDVREIMSAADGYLMSSAWEGMPVVLLEAAAAELPIVATDVGGNSEVVGDGVTGFLMPSGDAAALAASMEKLEALARDERLAMGARGRAHIEREYGTRHIMDQWEALYSTCAATAGAELEAVAQR